MRIICSNIIGHQIISVHKANTIVIFAKRLINISLIFQRKITAKPYSLSGLTARVKMLQTAVNSMDINQHGDIRCDRSEERDNEANNNNHQHVASLEDGLPRRIAAIYRCRMAIVKRIADILN